MMKVAALRRALGLNQSELARVLAVARMTIWRWEAGRAIPRPRHQAALAGLLERYRAGTWQRPAPRPAGRPKKTPRWTVTAYPPPVGPVHRIRPLTAGIITKEE